MGGRLAKYTTKQSEAVMTFLQSQKGKHFTAARIEAHFAENGVAIGRTTIYRQLDRLTREGKVRKYNIDENTATCYQYIEEPSCNDDHFHLKCEKCGELIHTNGKVMPGIARSIRNEYGFNPTFGKVYA
jgi:Fur family ferric uptake transcriptional regulator